MRKTRKKNTQKKALYNFFSDFQGKKGKKNYKKKRNTFGIKLLRLFRYIKLSWFIAGVCVILLGSLVFVIFLSPFFKISSSSVFIYRRDTLVDLNRAYQSLDYIRGKNVFLLDHTLMGERIKKTQPITKDISFRTSFPNILDIYISSHNIMFQTNDYLILENGAIITKDGKKYLDIPTINLIDIFKHINIFEKKMDTLYLEKLQRLLGEIERNIPLFRIKNIEYHVKAREVLITNENDSIFIFDLTTDLKDQIRRISIYNKEKQSLTETPYIYIDARIPERLYICDLENEYQCRINLRKVYGDDVFIRQDTL